MVLTIIKQKERAVSNTAKVIIMGRIVRNGVQAYEVVDEG